MVMAAPKSNLSIVRPRAELQAVQRFKASALDNSVANGDRTPFKSVQTGVVPMQQQDATSTDDASTFEAVLVQTALDSLFDGVLIVNTHGDIIQANRKAQYLLSHAVPAKCCPDQLYDTEHSWPQALQGTQALPPSPHPLQPLLDEIWRVCETVIDSRATFPQQDVILDSEVTFTERSFRIRVRWMNDNVEAQSCLIVSIEDLLQTALNQINGDRWKYRLTPRETEVWGLKRRGYSYRAIAKTLYVTENTVKKHLKNIQAKRRAGGDLE
ncbi:MAG: hypothetical protein F6K30_11480 [Cyanothece sp. SIO2G6]|nr:hypothetical protein [Cyanothece sp. SIO2G6]